MLVVLLGGGWLVLESQGSALASRAVGSGRDVTCAYLAQINRLPHDAHTVHVWIPLAKTSREQRVLRRDVHAPVLYTVAQDPDYGNDVLHAMLEPPIPEHLEIAIEYRVRLVGPDDALADPPPTLDELQRNLQSSGLVIIDETVRARARQATAGQLTKAAQAKGIYDYVRHTMAYDKTVPGWGRGDTRRACLLSRGNCTDFHSLFISMARAERIPARFKIGVVIPKEPSGVIPGYHCWAEFYADGQGWVPVDASEAWKHPELADYYFGARDPSRFLISVGRDIRLVPRQQGDPVNIFFAPYVEVDGQVFPDVGVEVRFTDLQQGRTI
ncbi:MAG: transglutaminase domain-containing protein [Candidatus Omnitrophica bacterium]|nr:transglutaminase domain-containing protein [Candidatus Omnitrophota bacterium]